MNKITKIFLVILSTVSFTLSQVSAGELAVTGGATATYKIGGADGSAGKGLGVSNELDFTASGELDNGFTWTWQTQLDGASTFNDDTKMVVGTDYGSVAMMISEGGLSSELGYGIGAMGVGSDYTGPMTIKFGTDVDNYNSLQYHMPAGMLPYGIVAKVAYVPNLSSTAGSSAKADGAVETNAVGKDATMYRVDAEPMAGLKIGADYFNASGSFATRYEEESASAYAKYSMGAFTVGIAQSGYSPTVNTGTESTFYETNMYGIQFAVNDALSLSYSQEKTQKSVRTAVANAATVGTKVELESTIDHLQAAYVMGGATLGVAFADEARDEVRDEVIDVSRQASVDKATFGPMPRLSSGRILGNGLDIIPK
jgi:hypothetical protein